MSETSTLGHKLPGVSASEPVTPRNLAIVEEPNSENGRARNFQPTCARSRAAFLEHGASSALPFGKRPPEPSWVEIGSSWSRPRVDLGSIWDGSAVEVNLPKLRARHYDVTRRGLSRARFQARCGSDFGQPRVCGVPCPARPKHVRWRAAGRRSTQCRRSRRATGGGDWQRRPRRGARSAAGGAHGSSRRTQPWCTTMSISRHLARAVYAGLGLSSCKGVLFCISEEIHGDKRRVHMRARACSPGLALRGCRRRADI